MSIHPAPRARAAFVLVFALVLSACGGGGVVTVDPPASAVSTVAARTLDPEFLARKAVSYSPFRTSDRENEKNTLTDAAMKANIKQDLDLLVAGGFTLIRLFDSSDEVSRRTLEVIRDNHLDMKVQLGAYVNSFKYALNPTVVAYIKGLNQAELDRTVALANAFGPAHGNIVLTVSVGNETMVSWSIVPIDPLDMAGYIAYVRRQVAQPVTTDDNWAFYASPPKAITDVIDFASVHTYTEIDSEFPDIAWDWKQKAVALGAWNDRTHRAVAMMDAAMVATRLQYSNVRDAFDRKGLSAMPITIGETGWNAVDQGKLRYRAHPVNQKMYFDRLSAWRAAGRTGAGPGNVFYFEAFDEPWKGSDDKWGLFNVARQARYVIQNLYPSNLWEAGSYTDADALAFVPPVINPAVTQNTYTLYSDAPAAVIATGLRVDAFDGNSVSAPEKSLTAAPGDGTRSIEITPVPKDYGWGLLYSSTIPYGSENLSNFAATGTLNVWIKTAYAAPAGKIEIGLSTDTAEGDVQEAYLQIGNGDYGYRNDDAWHLVSIPLQAFLAVNAKLDFRLVLTRFAIADRYRFTGKALNSNITTKINLDAIFWAR